MCHGLFRCSCQSKVASATIGHGAPLKLNWVVFSEKFNAVFLLRITFCPLLKLQKFKLLENTLKHLLTTLGTGLLV